LVWVSPLYSENCTDTPRWQKGTGDGVMVAADDEALAHRSERVVGSLVGDDLRA